MNKAILSTLFAIVLLGTLALLACAPAATPTAAPAASTATPVVIKYPTGPIKVIVARGTGGSTDTIARLTAPYLQKNIGQAVAVENNPGGGGVLGTDEVYKAKPDGQTLLFAANTTDILKQIGEGTPYDYMKFVPVYNIGGIDSNIIVVNAASPYKSMQDLIAAFKAKKVSVSKTSGISTSSIGLAWLVQQAGVPKDNMNIVPYEDGKSQALAVAGGHVEVAITQASNVISLVKDQKLRVLLTFSKDRAALFPDVPTFKELYPGDSNYYEFMQGYMAPPGTPDAVIKILNDALDKATADQEFRDKAKALFTVVPMRSDKFKAELTAFYSNSLKQKDMFGIFEVK